MERLRYIAQRLIPTTDGWNARAKQWKWEVNLLGSKDLNAFCMPGGKIAFYFGILSQLQLTDDEVATIMGHEMAHALREHARERMGKTAAHAPWGAGALSALLGLGNVGDAALNMGAQLLTLRFSREDESEADIVGMDIAARGGYDPAAGVTLWQKMMAAAKGAPPQFMSTHPAGETRIKDIEGKLGKVTPIYSRRRNRSASSRRRRRRRPGRRRSSADDSGLGRAGTKCVSARPCCAHAASTRMRMPTTRNNRNMASSPTDAPWSLPELTRARRAIVVVDVVESVRLMQEDEAGFIDRWRRFVHEVRTEVLPKHGGRLVKSLGDGMLLEFERLPQAMAAALRLQLMTAQLAPLPLRIGAHVGDVVVDELDLYGTGVNLAARLATLARPGEVVRLRRGPRGLVAGRGRSPARHGRVLRQAFGRASARLSHCCAGNEDAPSPPMALDDLRPTIAVLPFHADDGVVCADLLTEALTAGLSRSSALNVISRLSCLTLRGRADSLQIAGSTLRADYVLSGRVIHDGARFTAVAELANARSSAVVWAAQRQRFDQWAVGVAVPPRKHADRRYDAGGSFACAATRARQRAAVARDLRAPVRRRYAAASHGRRDFDRAHDLLQAAADRAPRHPSPQAWLAQWHVLRAQQGWVSNPQETAGRARDCAQRALDADPEDSLALTMEALVHVHFLRRLDEAAALYEKAVTVNPNDSQAWLHKGMLHAFRGQAEAGVNDTERALTLSPLDPMKYYYDSPGRLGGSHGGPLRACHRTRRTLAHHQLPAHLDAACARVLANAQRRGRCRARHGNAAVDAGAGLHGSAIPGARTRRRFRGRSTICARAARGRRARVIFDSQSGGATPATARSRT